MPYMTRILDDLKAAGLTVEVVPGWETRGSASFAPAGVICHWTAGPRGLADRVRASLRVVLNGRPNSNPKVALPGPLCNVYLDRAGVCVIVAAGRANHAGAGEWRGVKGNSGFYGIEAEAADNGDWTPAQRAVYPRLVAALLRGLDRGAEWVCGHSEYALPRGRKVDINGYTTDQLRADVARHLNTIPTPQTESEEDEMLKGFIFSSQGKDGKPHLYAAFPNAREYDYIDDDAELNDYKNVLRKQGFQVEDWPNAKGTNEVVNPDVFGRYIGPASVKPAGAKREG